MKIELSQEDIKNILQIINSAQITGAGAETIVELKRKITTPIVEEEPNKQR